MDNILKKRYLYIANGFFILLFMGCSNAWGIFVVPLENAYGWLRSQTSLAFTLNVLAFSVGNISAGILSGKLSFKLLMKIAALMIGTGFFLSSFATQAWQIYFTYSLFCGVGIGLGYNGVISSCPTWFPEKPGMITGILLMGYALSTAILGPVINTLIGTVGIASTFKVLAVACAVALFIGSFNLEIPDIEQLNQLPQRDRAAGKKTHNVITSEMIKLPIFWLYFFVSGFFGAVGLAIMNHASPIMIEELSVTASTAALVVSLLSIGNGAGRFIGGIIYDKIGMKKMLMFTGVGMLAMIVLIYVGVISGMGFLFIAAACGLMFTFGCNATSVPTILRELFGHRTFSLNFSVLNLNALISSTLPTIVGTLQAANGNYRFAMLVLVGVLAINACLVLVMLKLQGNSEN